MTQSALQTLVLSAVRDIDPTRLQRAVCQIADGSLSVTLVRQSEIEVIASVRNGDGMEYEVALSHHRAFCSCPDSRLRHSVCKHAIATVLRILQMPQPKEQPTIQPFTSDIFHLKWSDGETLCGAPRYEKAWFGWTPYMTTWPEACSACVAVYRQPKPATKQAA